MQTNPEHRPAWLSDRDLADRYAVSRITIWRWARNGVIPPGKKIGPNTTRWSAAEIEAHDAEMVRGGEAA
jgi:predicted DNA-binding transcriptional regulator AlpA